MEIQGQTTQTFTAFVSPTSRVLSRSSRTTFRSKTGRRTDFNAFDDNVLYEIHVDNDGNARDDVTCQFRFRTKVPNPNSFLYNTGPIDSLDDTDWNMPQTYRVTEVRGRSRDVLGTRLPTPPVNIGPRSIPAYESLRAAAIHTLSNGIKVFAGQVDDPFFVDLSSVFDLAGLRPFNTLHILPLTATAGGVDGRWRLCRTRSRFKYRSRSSRAMASCRPDRPIPRCSAFTQAPAAVRCGWMTPATTMAIVMATTTTATCRCRGFAQSDQRGRHSAGTEGSLE